MYHTIYRKSSYKKRIQKMSNTKAVKRWLVIKEFSFFCKIIWYVFVLFVFKKNLFLFCCTFSLFFIISLCTKCLQDMSYIDQFTDWQKAKKVFVKKQLKCVGLLFIWVKSTRMIYETKVLMKTISLSLKYTHYKNCHKKSKVNTRTSWGVE